MAYNFNIGYQFARENIENVRGGVILASTIEIHTLDRRELKKYPHLENRLFDPQLYLAQLDPLVNTKHCAKLASYPWFASPLDKYSSSEQNQSKWKKSAENIIPSVWKGKPTEDEKEIDDAAYYAVDFQVQLGCKAIILPSPLTQDPFTTYDLELKWLESGIKHAKAIAGDLPCYATVAIQDICLRTEPTTNSLLEMIADVLTARGVEGVYLVIEQSQEPGDTRQCNLTRTLHSVLNLIHSLSQYGNLNVIVNSLGAFGMVCLAAGASEWASDWYLSLYRVRLADGAGDGYAFPSYWSNRLLADIHLERDFDRLVVAGYLDKIETLTTACTGLLAAAKSGHPIKAVPEWVHRQSNVTNAKWHFQEAVATQSHLISSLPLSERINFVQQWLDETVALAKEIRTVLGATGDTKLSHQAVWAEAFRLYRRDHNL